MANDAHAWIGGQHALDALRHRVGAIGDRDLSGVQRVANAYSAAVVDRNPRGSRGRIQQGIQQRPVGYGVTAVFHAFGFAERRSYRAAIEVIAPNHDRSLDRTFLHQLVDGEAKPRPLAISQPADSRWESLELDEIGRA